MFPEPRVNLQFDWISYDEIFAGIDLSAWQTVAALGKLVASGIGEAFDARKRGFFDGLDHTLRWYAGYVVAWVENPEFQKRTRDLVYDKLKTFQPDVLLAHSLGSLVTYNALTHADLSAIPDAAAAAGRLNYVTLGAQIGNPFVVRNLTTGRVEMPPVKKWFHLYNEKDAVFTTPIRLPGEPKFEQVDARFDDAGFPNHNAMKYLTRPATIARVWTSVAAEAAPAAKSIVKLNKPATSRPNQPRRRAVLVGINDYPDPAARLQGCVNDVFLMSEVLQECNYSPDQIRVCLDDRATAQGIRERLEWLVADAQPGDQLVFFYSGHGAQIPTYGEGDEIDHIDETLVPWDFDWTPEHSVLDDQIFHLYSQLPYDTRLVLMFDCCHAGGMHRLGSRKGRGLEPPDDIRHRSMRWNAKEEMWEDRDLQPLIPDFVDKSETLQRYCGAGGNVRRLGRAMSLREMSQRQYDSVKKQAGGPVGPYLPLILEACQEKELASEYRHGNESYGAFTFAMAQALRSETAETFSQLVERATKKLRRLGYDQTPQILGPADVVSAKVPWLDKGADSPGPGAAASGVVKSVQKPGSRRTAAKKPARKKKGR